jgi:hypothetical protein
MHGSSVARSHFVSPDYCTAAMPAARTRAAPSSSATSPPVTTVPSWLGPTHEQHRHTQRLPGGISKQVQVQVMLARPRQAGEVELGDVLRWPRARRSLCGVGQRWRLGVHVAHPARSNACAARGWARSGASAQGSREREHQLEPCVESLDVGLDSSGPAVPVRRARELGLDDQHASVQLDAVRSVAQALE